MPIEIKELVIKSTVGDAAMQDASAVSKYSVLTNEEREALIKEIVDRVLKVLEAGKR